MKFNLIRSIWLAVFLLAAAIAGAASQGSEFASALPLQARNLSVTSQGCIGPGFVRVNFAWDSSGRGSQWFDLSRLSNFAGWGNQGPFPPQIEGTSWILETNTIYYARVSTFEPQGLTRSNTIQFRTISCPGDFTPPSNVDADVFDSFVRVSWSRGNGNLFFCVDTALTQADLLNFRSSWRNWGCGITATQLDLTQLACGQAYFVRVWATSATQSGHSEVDRFTTRDCDFTPPSNPRASIRSATSIEVRWSRGTDNHFYCIDMALTQGDLTGLTGSWFNTNCGTTSTSAVVTGLLCGREYFYRIWAAGTQESGYSPMATITTLPCDFEPPDDLSVEVQGEEHVVFSWDEEDPALWFCVDVAGSEADLLAFSGSWRNFDCGGTDETADVMDAYFECGETYYWRVFAFAGSASGHSEASSFEMTC